jgi:hypothetical protein
MNILITENQFIRITEQVAQLDSFMSKLINKFPEVEEFKDKLMDFIINSGCKKIEFANFRFPAMGLALHDGVLINNSILSNSLSYVLFVLFHEIAHQYQYKKYGAELMYKVYTDKISITDAAKWMKNTEETADEFAERKCREFINLGYIDEISFKRFYKSVSLSYFENFIYMVKSELKNKNLKSDDEISSYFYNKIKSVIE